MGARSKAPDEAMVDESVELKIQSRPSETIPPYERLLAVAATEGDQTLFARQDEVEAAWGVVDPILDDTVPVRSYEKGSWGPPAADGLVRDLGGWIDPVASPHEKAHRKRADVMVTDTAAHGALTGVA